MSGRMKRLAMSSTVILEKLGDIEHQLADGWQPEEDAPVIDKAITIIKREMLEIEDVELDIVAAMRTLNCGRRKVVDTRFAARNNALERTKATSYLEYEAA